REREVDEVRRLHQADCQEELTRQLALRLRLPRDAADERVTGDAVTDTGADGAATESEPTADQAASGGYCLGDVFCCHCPSLPFEAGVAARARQCFSAVAKPKYRMVRNE